MIDKHTEDYLRMLRSKNSDILNFGIIIASISLIFTNLYIINNQLNSNILSGVSSIISVCFLMVAIFSIISPCITAMKVIDLLTSGESERSNALTKKVNCWNEIALVSSICGSIFFVLALTLFALSNG
jgi:hypothetical protein